MAKNEKPSAQASKPEAKKAEAEQQAAEQAQPAPAKSSGLIKYILFGVGGIGLLAAAMFVTLYFVGGKKAQQAKPDTPQQLAQKIIANAKEPKTQDTAKAETKSTEDSLQAAADSVDQMDQLVKNIEVLNQAADSEAARAAAMSQEDSLKAVTWLDQKKAELDKRERDLTDREAKLEKLNKDVAAKTLKFEQASSDRVTNLAKLYDGMDSDAVAKLVANLDDSLVVAILPRMKQKNASQLLALIPPQRAAKISKAMITLAGE